MSPPRPRLNQGELEPFVVAKKGRAAGSGRRPRQGEIPASSFIPLPYIPLPYRRLRSDRQSLALPVSRSRVGVASTTRGGCLRDAPFVDPKNRPRTLKLSVEHPPPGLQAASVRGPSGTSLESASGIMVTGTAHSHRSRHMTPAVRTLDAGGCRGQNGLSARAEPRQAGANRTGGNSFI